MAFSHSQLRIALTCLGISPAPPTHPSLQPEPVTTARPTSERDVLTYLARFGVPVIGVQVTHSAEEAVAAARRMGVPVVLKIVSADIAHKTDIGGALGSDLQALEVNPLFARGEQIEALDALAVWKPG